MAKGLKREEIEDCILCGKGVGHSNVLTFYRVRIENFLVNLPAVQRQAGLEMMIGNPLVAHVMGPNEDLAVTLGEPLSALVCFDCACRPHAIVSIMERMQSREDDREAERQAPEEEASN